MAAGMQFTQEVLQAVREQALSQRWQLLLGRTHEGVH